MQHTVTSEPNFASSAAAKVNVFTSQPSLLLHTYADIATEGEHSNFCVFISLLPNLSFGQNSTYILKVNWMRKDKFIYR